MDAALPAIFPDLDGASVFVTGGASGIGAALVAGFAAQGARVALIDLADGAALAQQIGARAPRPLALQGDVTDQGALTAALDKAMAAHGPLDVLVNNAANDARYDPDQITPAQWDAMMAVNLGHVFFASQHAARAMKGRGGRIVNFSSIAHMMGMAELAPYSAAKAGIAALTRSLARAWGSSGIRVNAVLPGMVLTPRQLDLWITPQIKDEMIARQALPVEIGAEDMVGPTLFLASRASGVITGQCLIADGGLVGQA